MRTKIILCGSRLFLCGSGPFFMRTWIIFVRTRNFWRTRISFMQIKIIFMGIWIIWCADPNPKIRVEMPDSDPRQYASLVPAPCFLNLYSASFVTSYEEFDEINVWDNNSFIFRFQLGVRIRKKIKLIWLEPDPQQKPESWGDFYGEGLINQKSRLWTLHNLSHRDSVQLQLHWNSALYCFCLLC